MKKYTTWEEYLNDLPPQAKERLLELKEIITEALPYYEESWGYGVPAFNLIPNAKLNDKIMMNAYKNHVGFYPHKDTLNHFKDELKDFKVLESTLQIKYTQVLPKDLLKRMVQYRYNQVVKK